MADFYVSEEFNKRIIATPTTLGGKAAQLDGALVASSDNEAVATVVVEAEGSVLVVTHAPGTAVITLSGDADRGEGVKTIVKSFTIEVVSATADGFSLSEGVDVEKVAPTEPTA